jgi:hypothetical protein
VTEPSNSFSPWLSVAQSPKSLFRCRERNEKKITELMMGYVQGACERDIAYGKTHEHAGPNLLNWMTNYIKYVPQREGW